MCASMRRICLAIVRRPAGQPHRQPGDGESQDVAEIVTGVRDQSDGVGQKPIDRLSHDVGRVERNPDRERGPEVRGRVVVMMPMPVIMMIVVVVVVVSI